MAITTTHNIKATFNKLLKAWVAQLQTEINAIMGTAVSIAFYAQRQPTTYPSVRVWWPSDNGGLPGKNRMGSMVQISIMTRANPEAPDDKFPDLLKRGIMEKIGFTTKKANAKVVWIQPKDYATDLVAPVSYGRKFKVELVTKEGFRFVPEPDTNIWHYAARFLIEHH